jgi:hypothetical protein
VTNVASVVLPYFYVNMYPTENRELTIPEPGMPAMPMRSLLSADVSLYSSVGDEKLISHVCFYCSHVEIMNILLQALSTNFVTCASILYLPSSSGFMITIQLPHNISKSDVEEMLSRFLGCKGMRGVDFLT